MCFHEHIVIDNFGRQVNSIRISLTNKCNLNCFYCHNEGNSHSNKEMTLLEIEKILMTASELGIKKVKFTGGEPLLRKDMVQIIEIAKKYMTKDISITTNGILLENYAKELKNAGLKRINISLDTLDENIYQKITGMKSLDNVINGLKKATELSFNPIKINMVVLKGVNDHEIWNMIEFAREYGIILQLIELEELENFHIKKFEKLHFDLKRLEKELEKIASRTSYNELHKRKKYMINDCEVEIVRSIHNSDFCKNCTRIRVTSNGELKTCLMRSDNHIKLSFEKDIKEKFMQCINIRKPYW